MTGLANVNHKAFYLYVLILHFVLVQHTFSTTSTVAVGHSWEDYIYSLPMRYAARYPFAIYLVSTALAISAFTVFAQLFSIMFPL